MTEIARTATAGAMQRFFERRRARRTYWQRERYLGALNTALYRYEDPRARAALLDEHAATESQLAVLHPTAFGDPHSVGHDETAPLYRLAAAAERALAASQWTRAQDLRAGQEIWFEENDHLITDKFTVPGRDVHLFLADGREVVFEPGERLRTGGPGADLFGMAIAAGADATEAELWDQLAFTRDRQARAELLLHLHLEVADRVGGQVAEALAALADTETHLARVAAGQPVRSLAGLPRREVIGAGFFILGAGIAATSALPPLELAPSVAVGLTLVLAPLGVAALVARLSGGRR
jgi:hypothetical protein